MKLGLDISTFNLVVFLLLGMLLLLLFRGTRHLLGMLQMSKARRATIARALPIVELLVGLLYILSAAPMVVSYDPNYSALALALIIFGFVWVSGFALRDFLSGIFIKAGQICQVGDTVALEGTRGRVIRLGFRVVAIQTTDGSEAIIPYSRISRQSVIRTPATEGAHRHFFHVQRADAPADAKLASRIVLEVALTHHYASITREPLVIRRDDGRLAVTVFALEPHRGPDIEQVVRRALLDARD